MNRRMTIYEMLIFMPLGGFVFMYSSVFVNKNFDKIYKTFPERVREFLLGILFIFAGIVTIPAGIILFTIDITKRVYRNLVDFFDC